ncbi:aspartyl protease family protein [Rhizobacter sp. P5_C2]
MALAAAGLAVPPPVHLTYLIDTGASATQLDDSIIRTLGLDAKGGALVHTASTDGVARSCDVYDVRLYINGLHGPDTWHIDPLEVLATPLLNQPFQALLGRDVLMRARFTLDGWAGHYILDY